MDDIFATFESLIKKIFEIIAGIFKIFETPAEGEEGETTEGEVA